MKYRLYGLAGTRSIRVSWLLEELELEYEFISLLPHSKEILAVNPSGKIPTLLVDNHPISDSAAICLYLCDKHPQKGLSAPCATIERAEIDSWLYFAQSELEAPVWAYRKHKKTTQLIPDNLKINIKDWVEFEFSRSVETLLTRLGSRDYAMGDNFSVVDIFLAQIGQWARHERLAIPEKYRRYIDRIWARPALARARQKEKEQ